MSKNNNKKRITIYIDDVDDHSDYLSMEAWINKWKKEIYIESYSTGGAEHVWDIEAPNEAVKEIPKDWLCVSKWAGIG